MQKKGNHLVLAFTVMVTTQNIEFTQNRSLVIINLADLSEV